MVFINLAEQMNWLNVSLDFSALAKEIKRGETIPEDKRKEASDLFNQLSVGSSRSVLATHLHPVFLEYWNSPRAIPVPNYMQRAQEYLARGDINPPLNSQERRELSDMFYTFANYSMQQYGAIAKLEEDLD